MASERGFTVSNDTIRRRLDATGLCVGIPKKGKTLIRAKHMKIRFKSEEEYETWTTKYQKRVLWTDEFKSNLFGSDGGRYIRRPKRTKMGTRTNV